MLLVIKFSIYMYIYIYITWMKNHADILWFQPNSQTYLLVTLIEASQWIFHFHKAKTPHSSACIFQPTRQITKKGSTQNPTKSCRTSLKLISLVSSRIELVEIWKRLLGRHDMKRNAMATSGILFRTRTLHHNLFQKKYSPKQPRYTFFPNTDT